MSKSQEAGKRYELVKAALNGGCPDIISEINSIIDFIDTGDKKYVATKAEQLLQKKEEVEKTTQELQEVLQEKGKKLEMLREMVKEIQFSATSLTKETLELLREEMKILLDTVGQEMPTPTGKYIAQGIAEVNSVYVEIDGFLHKITDVNKVGTKAILSFAPTGYKRADNNKNGISQKEKHYALISLLQEMKTIYKQIHEELYYYYAF